MTPIFKPLCRWEVFHCARGLLYIRCVVTVYYNRWYHGRLLYVKNIDFLSYTISSVIFHGLSLVLNNQREDQDLKTIIEAKMTQTRPPNPKPQTGQCSEQRRLLQLWDHLLFKNKLLYRKYIDHLESSTN